MKPVSTIVVVLLLLLLGLWLAHQHSVSIDNALLVEPEAIHKAWRSAGSPEGPELADFVERLHEKGLKHLRVVDEPLQVGNKAMRVIMRLEVGGSGGYDRLYLTRNGAVVAVDRDGDAVLLADPDPRN